MSTFFVQRSTFFVARSTFFVARSTFFVTRSTFFVARSTTFSSHSRHSSSEGQHSSSELSELSVSIVGALSTCKVCILACCKVSTDQSRLVCPIIQVVIRKRDIPPILRPSSVIFHRTFRVITFCPWRMSQQSHPKIRPQRMIWI